MSLPIVEQGYTHGSAVYDGTDWQKAKGEASGVQHVKTVPGSDGLFSLGTPTSLYYDRTQIVAVGNPTESLVSSTVPANTYRYITFTSMINANSAGSRGRVIIIGPPTSIPVETLFASVINAAFTSHHTILLEPGFYMQVDVRGHNAGDNIIICFHGYDMLVS